MSESHEKYPVSSAKHGPIYHVAKGVRVGKSVDGTWEIVIQIDGKRTRARSQSLSKAINAAELSASKLGLSLSTKFGGDAPAEYTMAQAANDWMKMNRARWQPATIERYKGLLDGFILPRFGCKALVGIDRTHIKQFLADLRDIRSPKHVEVTHSVLSGIFKEAIDSGHTRENPAYGLLGRLLPPKKRRNQSNPDPFGKDDRDKMMESCWKHLPKDLAMVIEVMAMTGMRIGEALAMKIDNLDASNAQYFIKEKVRHGLYGLPKSGDERLIDLPESLISKLQAHIKWLRPKMMQEGRGVDHLFPGLTERMVQSALKRACTAARLRTRTPHDLRHTYASLLLMEHYSPVYVQKQLGHSSISITVDVYGKWIPGEGRKDLDKTLRIRRSEHGSE